MKTVFFDIDTQLDFLCPAGALYVPDAEQIAPSLAKLTQFAGQNGIQIVSTLDTHAEDDPEFKAWKPHCVGGTQGWQKCSQTLLERSPVRQVLFEKNTIDFFPSEKLSQLLDELRADRFVVYGVVTEYCVRAAAFGLLERKARVEIVTDTIKSIDASRERDILGRFTSSGGRLTTIDKVVSEHHN